MIITKKFWCIDLERFAKFFDESTSVQSPLGLFSGPLSIFKIGSIISFSLFRGYYNQKSGSIDFYSNLVFSEVRVFRIIDF